MCGIVGYIGDRKASPILLDGLKRLEYRGYDSAGISVLNGDSLLTIKRAGRVLDLEKDLSEDLKSSNFGIAHTRWATHGKPNEVNAHPHSDEDGKISLVHNGIIENYQDLKDKLTGDGVKFSTETDTEVLAALIAREMKDKDSLLEAVKVALSQVEGAYGIAVISSDYPDTLIAAKQSSPLLIGVGEDEMFVASDASAILASTKKVVYLEDGEIAEITKESYRIESLGRGAEEIKREAQLLDLDLTDIEKGGHEHFMHKEIFEIPRAFVDATRGRFSAEDILVKLGGIESIEKELADVERIIIVACGTASYAGLYGEYVIEDLAGIPVELELGSEFRYRNPVFTEKTALIAISQSGETADTLAAVAEAKEHGAKVLGIVNVVGSTIAREVDAGLYTHAGPEISVASTKAFISQIAVLLLLAIYLGRKKGLDKARAKTLLSDLGTMSEKINAVLDKEKDIKALAKKYKDFKNFAFLGRRYSFPIALEGAMKLKETSYIHAEGFTAGEFKHGPIAMLDKDFPVFFLAPVDSVYEKTKSNLEEVRARSAPVIALTTEGNKELENLADDVIYIPKVDELISPFLSTIACYLFSYHVAALKGVDVDKPRNLAKSVTVE